MNVKKYSKNSFDPILGFGFNLGRLKMYTYVLNGVNFAKNYQKDSYNKIIFIEKNIDHKNILTTLKKHSYF
jgi:hypothetical protein